jgi:hypothetical protein
MPYLLTNFELEDYDRFKELFDSDPIGRKQMAKGHRILRSVDNPNEVFVGVEFASVDDANSFRDKLRAEGILENMTVKAGPAVVEVADEASY